MEKNNNEYKSFLEKGLHEIIDKNYENSIEPLSRFLDHEPANKLALLSRGSAYFKLNRLKEAVADFDRSIDLDPAYARAYHMRGLVRDKQGQDHHAARDFDKAIDCDPSYGAAYFSRATLFTKMGKADQALEDMQMVAHLTNRNIESFANENNVWRSQHMRLEDAMATDLER